MASIAVVISVNQAQDLIQLRATDEEGNMISSDVQKIDRPYCGTKTVTIDIPDEMIKHAIKKREYFAIGRKNGKEYVQIMQLVDWDKRNPWINTVTPCNNFDYRQKEKPMKTKKDIDRIVITKNDLNEVLLRAYSNDEIVEKTIAKCNPNDIFDFNIGAKLAVDRLYDGYDMTPKPKRKLYNGKIFARATMRSFFGFWDNHQENSILEVRNGIIIGFEGRRMDLIWDDMTDEELSKLLCDFNCTPSGFLYNFIDGYFVR